MPFRPSTVAGKTESDSGRLGQGCASVAPMTASAGPPKARAAARHVWLPRQHGVAASPPDAWQLVLAGAALAGYLVSSTVQAWSRARHAPEYRVPTFVYGALFAALGLLLVLAFLVSFVALRYSRGALLN